jgi:hypothetical protein
MKHYFRRSDLQADHGVSFDNKVKDTMPNVEASDDGNVFAATDSFTPPFSQMP